MANKMLIDAAHPEETRVVVLRGNRVEEFDFEAASKKPLRGNIYLAKVTRVEPSLQAAFIEYGGNRHGFLAFSEIHPDYYQIPVADRQALLDEEARAHREEEDEQRQTTPRRSRRRRGPQNGQNRRGSSAEENGEEFEHEASDAGAVDPEGGDDAEVAVAAEPHDHDHEPVVAATDEHDRSDETERLQDEGAAPAHADEPDQAEDWTPPTMAATAYEEPSDRVVSAVEEVSVVIEEPLIGDDVLAGDEGQIGSEAADEALVEDREAGDVDADSDKEAVQSPSADGEHEDEVVEQLGGDALEDVPYRTPRLRRHYKIQEVIKRRQILLVQVVKEERGNKGAALTTYLSLAGRYSVLMPNTARGGGISRKITDSDDRKRLKSIAQDLEVPEGMGIILRTAGASRSESEVKRDFEYLLRMWETVRELTLRSSAPMLVYEEGSLIKRAIRDLYSKDIDEVIVAGDEGYREAKDFMRLLMPTHTRNVIAYRDPQPIFAKSGAEAQLDAMFSNHVTLRSGGYIVINQTEALVAIDVNSGRSTREHNIEDTALRTNLEAADEVARQLRLRDLAGLIVVDFIDMEEGRNNRAVERRIKDALKNDRARIQIGRISHFGLLEMSRQRIRTGVLEGSTVLCPHCAGAGTVRSTSSIALHVLRVLEDHFIRSAAHNLLVRTRMEVALYILNQKRAHLNELESRFGATVTVMADVSLTGTVYHAIERGEPATPVPSLQAKTPALGYGTPAESEEEDLEDEIETDEEEAGDETAEIRSDDQGEGDGQSGGDRRRKRRRRRRGRDRDNRPEPSLDAAVDQPSDAGMENMALIGGDLSDAAAEPAESETTAEALIDAPDESPVVTAKESEPAEQQPVESDVSIATDEEAKEIVEAPRRRRSRRVATRGTASTEGVATPEAEEAAPVVARRSRRPRARAVVEDAPSLALDVPSADRDVGADTVKNHPTDPGDDTAPVFVTPEETAAPAASTEAETPLAAEAPPAAAPDPDRPKRSGWWQRAKATITG